MKRWHFTLLTIATLLTMGSCDSSVFFDEHHSIDNASWSLHSPERYVIEIDDSLLYYDFYIDLRIRDSYKYSNLFLFITTTFPDGSLAKDTLECPIADPEGKWLGKHSGSMVDYRFPVCRKVRFPQVGVYHFDVIHGMRDRELEGVKDLGMRMEYHNNK